MNIHIYLYSISIRSNAWKSVWVFGLCVNYGKKSLFGDVENKEKSTVEIVDNSVDNIPQYVDKWKRL